MPDCMYSTRKLYVQVQYMHLLLIVVTVKTGWDKKTIMPFQKCIVIWTTIKINNLADTSFFCDKSWKPRYASHAIHRVKNELILICMSFLSPAYTYIHDIYDSIFFNLMSSLHSKHFASCYTNYITFMKLSIF